ncbi:MAG: restriction endonuclease subunit S [Dehalococcoidia bacterium]|nr:restriction endonuclease subunit S [Dehalococcoidia bacterium]
MSGLEAVEINISECLKIIDFRIDANTYQKDYVLTEKHLSSIPHKRLKDCTTKIQNFGAYSLCNEIVFSDIGHPFLMTQNINHNYIDWSDIRHIDDKSHALLHKSHCVKNQVLITMAGSLGRVAVYDKDFVSSSNQAIAKLSVMEGYEPYYISTFLNTRYGQNQINRFKTITAQPNINMGLISELKIALASERFQKQLAVHFAKIENLLSQSANLYASAESRLLSALGMENFTPSNEPVSIKSFSESFGTSGRLDAEYYQKKFEDVENAVKSGDYSSVLELVSFIDHGKQPPYIDNGKVKVFSQKWIGDKSIDYSFLTAEDEPYTSQEFADANSEYVSRMHDILYYSVGANIGYCHNYFVETPSMAGSFITIIRADKKKVDLIYLGVALNSFIGRMQAEKWKSASAQPYIYPKDIQKFVIPLVAKSVQHKIAIDVQQSFELRRQSEYLLNSAKLAVEMAIEDGEEMAMKWLENRAL